MNINHPQCHNLKLENIYISNKKLISYNKLINKLTFWNKSIDKDIYSVLEDFSNQMEDINNILQPLEEFGIYYSLWLAGGSIRDLFCGKAKDIKDLDIVIKMEPIIEQFFNKKLDTVKFNTFIDFCLPTEDLKLKYKSPHYIQNNFPFEHWFLGKKSNIREIRKNHHFTRLIEKSIDFELLECIFDKKNILKESFHPIHINNKENKKLPEYINSRLLGVLKINK